MNTRKKIVIVGIGNIGFSIIKELNTIDNSIDIVAIDKIFPDYLNEFINKDTAKNKIIFIEADINNESDVQELINNDKLNKINILISTVGYSSGSYDFDKYRQEFNINFFGNVIPIKALINKIPHSQNNRVIIISSTSGNKAPKTVNSYAPSKWALESFSSSLQHEYLKEKIFIDIIRPTNIVNEYSESFKIQKGISATLVAKNITNQIQLSLRNSRAPGKKIFVPNYFFGVRILERVFPGILNYFSHLNSKSSRRKTYSKYSINKVLITGGASGLGRELAFIYSKYAKEIIITGRDENKLVDVKNELNKISNCKITIKKIDFTSIPDVIEFAKEIKEINLLINNAGQHLAKPVKETSINEYVKILDANFFSAVLLTQNLIKNNNLHKVINILSTTAICGRKNYSAYSASKSALWAYTRSMRRQNGNTIQFLEVIPETFKSDLFRNTTSEKEAPHPLKGSFGGFNNILESKEVAQRVFKAEQNGKDILFIPFKSRLFLLLESLFYPIFRKLFLK